MEHSNKRKQRQLNALLHFPRCMLSAVFAISLRRINTRRQSGFFPLYNDVAQKYCHLCTTRSHLHSFTPSLFFSVPLHSAPFHSLIVSLSVGSAHAEFHPIQKFKLIRFPKSLPFKIFETFCQRWCHHPNEFELFEPMMFNNDFTCILMVVFPCEICHSWSISCINLISLPDKLQDFKIVFFISLFPSYFGQQRHWN